MRVERLALLLVVCVLARAATGQIVGYTTEPAVYVVNSGPITNAALVGPSDVTNAKISTTQGPSTLPTGLSISATGGNISGTPTAATNGKVTYVIENDVGGTTHFYSLTIQVMTVQEAALTLQSLSARADDNRDKAREALETGSSLGASGAFITLIIFVILYFQNKKINKRPPITPDDVEYLTQHISTRFRSLALMNNEALADGSADADTVISVRSKRPVNMARAFSRADAGGKRMSSSTSQLNDVQLSEQQNGKKPAADGSEEGAGDGSGGGFSGRPTTVRELLQYLEIPEKHAVGLVREGLDLAHIRTLSERDLAELVPNAGSRQKVKDWMQFA